LKLQTPYFWTNQRQELHIDLLYTNRKKILFSIILIKTVGICNACSHFALHRLAVLPRWFYVTVLLCFFFLWLYFRLWLLESLTFVMVLLSLKYLTSIKWFWCCPLSNLNPNKNLQNSEYLRN